VQRAACTRHPKSHLGERAQRHAKLATLELAMRERADHLGAKQGDHLGVIART